MGLVNAKKIIADANKNGYAIGAFNINNLEWIKAILETVNETKTPVILETSEGAVKYMGGYKNVYDMVSNLIDVLKIEVPVCLHLDHGTYEGAKKALEVGYTSVMFDGSHYDINENLEKTKEIVLLAKKTNASVEAEVGGIGGTEDGVTSEGELADPKECALVAATGIDMLAAGIGNIHGVYPSNWNGLNFDRLAEIKKACNMPLVLHGGTGIPADMIKKAISLGVAKINVNTELQIAFAEATRKYIEDGLDKVGKGYDPRKLLAPGTEGIKAAVIKKIKIFGSIGKA